MIAFESVFDADTGLPNGEGANDGVNDGLWCQTTNIRNMIGSWFTPSGQAVSSIDDGNALHVVHSKSQIGLLRDGTVADDQRGLFTCTIPDSDAEEQSLVIWIGNNSTYNGK